jgi:hypothetical protein
MLRDSAADVSVVRQSDRLHKPGKLGVSCEAILSKRGRGSNGMEFVWHAKSGNCNYMPLQSLRKLICLYFNLRQDAHLLYNFICLTDI